MLCLHAKLLQSHLTLCNPMDCKPTRLLCPWDAPGRNTGEGCHALLRGIVPNQGSNPWVLCLLHWQVSSLPQEFFTWEALDSVLSSVQSLSHVWLFASPWTAARQASLSITNSRSLWLCQSLWLCGSQQMVENSWRLSAKKTLWLCPLFWWGNWNLILNRRLPNHFLSKKRI